MDLIKKCFVIGSDGDFTYKTLLLGWNFKSVFLLFARNQLKIKTCWRDEF